MMKDIAMTRKYEVISPTHDCLEPKTDYLELLLLLGIIRFNYYNSSNFQSQPLNHEINSIIIQKYILKKVLTSRCV